MKLSYRKGETEQLAEESTSSSTGVHNISIPGKGRTYRTYNVNGELVAFNDDRDANKNRNFVNNAQGQTLTAVQGNFDGQSGRLSLNTKLELLDAQT